MDLSQFVRRFHSKIYRTVNRSTHVSVEELRSSSDSGFYPEMVRRAALRSKLFENFKSDPVYRQILEHVSEEQGSRYIEHIEAMWPQLLKDIERYKVNDLVGNPIRYVYPQIGKISPTTLRYLKVACDLRELFGNLDGMNIAEIGIGYGGQFLLADRLWKLGSSTLFDLDPVLQLANRYLESHMVQSVYKPTTLNRFDARLKQFDLAISNYAFSELPKALQQGYIDKVLSKSRRGYMTMNSGKTTGDGRHMTIEELREHFPALKVLAEEPLTCADNYIVVWGG